MVAAAPLSQKALDMRAALPDQGTRPLSVLVREFYVPRLDLIAFGYSVNQASCCRAFTTVNRYFRLYIVR